MESCLLVNGEKSRWFLIQQGVKQGGMASPLLYALFVNSIVRFIRKEVGPNIGVEVGTEIIDILLNADDLVLMAQTLAKLQAMIDAAAKYAKKWKFKLCYQIKGNEGGQETGTGGTIQLEWQ